MTQSPLHDRRVLVVEDEYVIAEAMTRGLRRAGATVLGPVSNVAAALALLDDEPTVDAAVLDINLGAQKVYPVADVLRARGTPCVFATGNDAADVPAAYAAVTRCEKPVDFGCVVRALTCPSSSGRLDRAGRRAVLDDIRAQLLDQVASADAVGESLIAARLCEVIDAVDLALAGATDPS